MPQQLIKKHAAHSDGMDNALAQLPPEILLEIIKYLAMSGYEIASLLRTNRFFRNLVLTAADPIKKFITQNHWQHLESPVTFLTNQDYSFVHTRIHGESLWLRPLLQSNDSGELPYDNISFPQGYQLDDIILGYQSVFYLLKDEKNERVLFASGRNLYGELGVGDESARERPVPVKLPEGYQVVKVIAGLGSTFLIIKDLKGKKRLFSCGQNDFGQLGVGNQFDQSTFVQAAQLPDEYDDYDIEEVIIPNKLRRERPLFSDISHTFLFARNSAGNLALLTCSMIGRRGAETRVAENWTPVQLAPGYQPEKVITDYGQVFILAKDEQGKSVVFVGGANTLGQGGIPNLMGNNVPDYTLVQLEPGYQIKEVVVGDECSFLLTEDEKGDSAFFVKGKNDDGQLGVQDAQHRDQFTKVILPKGYTVTKIVPGDRYTLLLATDTEGKQCLFASGYGQWGEIGIAGKQSNNFQFTKVESVGKRHVLDVCSGNGNTVIITRNEAGSLELLRCGTDGEKTQDIFQVMERPKVLIGPKETVNKLREYRNKRMRKETEMKSIFNKAFHKFTMDQKINAVDALIASIEDPNLTLNPEHLPVLLDGNLRKLLEKSSVYSELASMTQRKPAQRNDASFTKRN